jgi:glycosyltransferase involved in cell wall biosynthesis
VLIVRLRRVTFVVHEQDDPRAVELGRRGRAQYWLEERVRRLFWRGARRLIFLSASERDSFEARFPAGARRASLVVGHGTFFTAAASASPADARARLGLATQRVILLMIGFLSARQPDKGYDRVLRALEASDDPRVDLHIVGSPIREEAEVFALIASLQATAARSPAVHFHERWVSDEEFDLWILAADAVLLPYRESSSSGVAARARLLGTSVITSGAGGLSEQIGPRDIIADTEAELVAAIARVADAAAEMWVSNG